MRASGAVGRVGGLALGLGVGLGIGAAAFAGAGAAWAAPESGTPTQDRAAVQPSDPGPAAKAGKPSRSRAARTPAPAAARVADRSAAVRRASASAAPAANVGAAVPAASAAPTASAATVSVDLPPMPVTKGRSFTVSRDVIAARAADYVAAGGNSNDNARFFFGDLAVSSLDQLAAPDVTPETVRTRLGSLAASGYFGGIWLRDNLRDNGTGIGTPPASGTTPRASTISAVGIRMFDALAAGLTRAAAGPNWLVDATAHVTVPVLLALYGYNRGYLQVVLENPPAGVPSMQDTLSCNGFLDCNSSAFPLEIATRYDDVLGKLADPTTLRWREMAMWTKVLESATGAGRSVWENIAKAGAFSPVSYAALVDLSSAYLMVSKAAVLSSMQAAAEGDAAVGRSSLRLQAGLWMWSGAYFGGLASSAPVGTLPRITVA